MAERGKDYGRINGWACPGCEQVTYVVHVDDGVTPFMLACRVEGVDPAEAHCKGMGTSLMYPGAPPPAHVVAGVLWEWYRPDADELAGMEPGMRDHIDRGGAALRKLTDAGRAALKEVHGGNV